MMGPGRTGSCGLPLLGEGLRLRTGLIACGAVLLAWGGTAAVEPPGADLPRHVALALAAGVVWAAAIWFTLGLPPAARGFDLLLVFGVAILLRAALVISPPSLSDDIYRAVWDARLLHAGVNPYAYAPAAEELAGFRDGAIWPRINHQAQRTPYAPLAEILGAVAYALGPESLRAMQLLAALADLATAALLAALLARTGADPRRCIVVAWSPFGALHFAHSGHNDAAMVAGFVGGALLLAYGRVGLAGAALGAATMVKWVPIVAVPAFGRVRGPTQLVAGWAAACAVLALPFATAGPGLLAGVLVEGTGQRFNESSFLLVERGVRALNPALAPVAASLFQIVSVALAVGLSWLVGGRTAEGALIAGSRVLAVFLLTAPVVEPWYLTWLAPLVALTVQRGQRGPFALNDAPAWLWLSAAATLTDLSYTSGGAGLWPWIRLAEYGPAYALLALPLVRRMWGRR